MKSPQSSTQMKRSCQIVAILCSWVLMFVATRTYSCSGNTLATIDPEIEPKAITEPLLEGSVDLDIPVVYVVTPTYYRLTQRADLIRLANTLRGVPNLHWVVVEDARTTSDSVFDILQRSAVWKWSQLCAGSPAAKDNVNRHRGVNQRNAGIEKVLELSGQNASQKGILYFADDDNAYDGQLFEEIRTIQGVGCWAIAFSGGRRYERCTVNQTTGFANGFVSGFMSNRKFALDMAAFAVNLELVHERVAQGQPYLFSHSFKPGSLETSFLEQFINTVGDLEVKGNCTKVWVWHTKTEIRAVAQPPENEHEDVNILV